MLKIVLGLRLRLEEGSCVFIDTQHGSKKGMPIKESASCRRTAEGGTAQPSLLALAACNGSRSSKTAADKNNLPQNFFEPCGKYKNDEPATAAAATRIM